MLFRSLTDRRSPQAWPNSTPVFRTLLRLMLTASVSIIRSVPGSVYSPGTTSRHQTWTNADHSSHRVECSAQRTHCHHQYTLERLALYISSVQKSVTKYE